MSIRMVSTCNAEIRAHAAAAFPEECCGFMLGHDDASGMRTITRVVRAGNTKGESRERRYLVAPVEQLATEKLARSLGLDVLGVYHSHPNHPSTPSELDRDHALPFWSYVIVSCLARGAAGMQSWLLRADRSRFDEETIEYH